MKKLALVSAVAAVIAAAAATITHACAVTALTPAVAAVSSPVSPNPHRDSAGRIAADVAEADSGVSSGCYYVRRNVLVPGIGIVSKPQLVCD